MPLDQTINTLQQLQDALDQESCIAKEPFIKLGTGTAPALNYNIPQTSCFSAYGTFPKGFSDEYFLESALAPPPNNFFEKVDTMSEADLSQKFAEAVQLEVPNSNFIPNTHLLRNVADEVRSDFDAVAKAVPATTEGEELTARVVAKRSFLNEGQLVRLAKVDNLMPVALPKFGGFRARVDFLPRPVRVTPFFAVIEEYRTCAYLGDYGAGRTVKTFSLLPGEKTTISIRTYKDMTATQARSENILDSFSESSADEMQKEIEIENGYSSNSTNTSSSSLSTTNNFSINTSISGSLFGLVKMGGGTNGSFSIGTNSSQSHTGSQTANSRAINRALTNHVAQSNSSRQVDVNVTTTSSISSGEEQTIIREIENYNKSRVLNFVFRQLLQEYITVTYLANIRIAFCNGYYESLKVVDLEDLDQLLKDHVEPAHIDEVRTTLLKPYCSVMNYNDEAIQFIEQFTVNYGECLGLNESETFWRIKKDLNDSYSSGGLNINVKGVILHVGKQTLRTSSLVVDALLGQGEALDCFNQKAQDAEALSGYLSNLSLLQQIESIENISDPVQRADMYKKIFSACCEVPQTQIIT